MNIAGIGTAKRVIGRDGSPAPLEDFERVVRINLIGTYSVIRLAAPRIAKLEPLEDGERGTILCTPRWPPLMARSARRPTRRPRPALRA